MRTRVTSSGKSGRNTCNQSNQHETEALMAKFDLEKMSLAELRDIEEKLPEIIASKEEDERREFLAFMQKEADKRGLDVKTMMSGSSNGRRKTGSVKPKYRNPSDASETWSGRGRTPRWMNELIKKGKRKEDFLIAK